MYQWESNMKVRNLRVTCCSSHVAVHHMPHQNTYHARKSSPHTRHPMRPQLLRGPCPHRSRLPQPRPNVHLAAPASAAAAAEGAL